MCCDVEITTVQENKGWKDKELKMYYYACIWSADSKKNSYLKKDKNVKKFMLKEERG